MTQLAVLRSDQLDYDAYAAMQARAFAEVVGARGMGGLLIPDYYRWKYATPWGQAFIATVWHGAEIVAASAMYPLAVAWGERRVRAWKSCDVATLPEARGKGYFMKCLHALQAELGDDSIFFGFPNLNSVRGFVKLGWEVREEMKGWARILPGGRRGSFRDIEVTGDRLADHDALAAAVAAMGGPMLERSSACVQWRYRDHPVNDYEIFTRRSEGRPTGFIVLRAAKWSGLRMGVVMDLIAEDDRSARRLLRFAAAWGRQRRLLFTVQFTNTLTPIAAARAGFLPVIEHQEVRHTLTQLREDYRTVIVLRFLSGLSPAETGQVMGRTPGAVRILQHRALSALRSLLEI